MTNNIVFTVSNTIYQVTQDTSSSNKHWFYRREIHDKNDIKSIAKTLARERKKKLWGDAIYGITSDVLLFSYWLLLSSFAFLSFAILNIFDPFIVVFLYLIPFVFLGVIEIHDHIIEEKKSLSQDDYKEIMIALKDIGNFPLVKKNVYHKTLGASHEVGNITINNSECNLIDVLLDSYQQVAFAQIFDLFAQDDLPETQHEKLQEAMGNYIKKHIAQQEGIVKEEPYSNLVDTILEDSRMELS